MAKFLNKKEQVIDFKLTSYGNYLLSVGDFNPTYYAFLDDNILYDGQYASAYHAGSPATLQDPTSFERQNDIHERIKDNTSYLESLVLFDDVEMQPFLAGSDMPQLIEEDEDPLGTAASAYFEADMTPTKMIPRKDAYRMQAMIGDAFLDGHGQVAPSWKIVAIQGQISSSSTIDGQNKIDIPQLNMNVNYVKKIVDFNGLNVSPNDIREIESTSTPFSDGKSIALVPDDVVLYVEEVNTELLTENFDIEVFEILTGSLNNVYKRKYFQTQTNQVVDGYMMSAGSEDIPDYAVTTSSVGYYFDVLTDLEVGHAMACKASEEFNNHSYYIDLDFDCTKDDMDEVYYDIYGRVTEPEIC